MEPKRKKAIKHPTFELMPFSRIFHDNLISEAWYQASSRTNWNLHRHPNFLVSGSVANTLDDLAKKAVDSYSNSLSGMNPAVIVYRNRPAVKDFLRTRFHLTGQIEILSDGEFEYFKNTYRKYLSELQGRVISSSLDRPEENN